MVDLSPRAHRLQVISGFAAACLILAVLVAIPFYSEEPLNQLQQIRKNGVLKVLTVNSAATYYHDNNGENGFEYELARLFADHLGVSLQMIELGRYADLYPELIFQTGDLAAAGLAKVDGEYSQAVLYSDAYHQVHPQVIYRKGYNQRPKNLGEIDSGMLEIIEGSSHEQLLKKALSEFPKLDWFANSEMGTEELIELVEIGLIDYALANSHEIALQRRFFPELRIAFQFKQAKPLRWAIKYNEDTSLLDEINRFLGAIKGDDRLQQLIHRYFGQVEQFNYSDLQTFETHLYDRLPSYQEMFVNEAEKHGLDWRLLAAIGYQESLWNPKAKSPTGVRGLMMLTQNTAKHVKIKNRLDPEQSIRGGATYFKQVYNKIPDRIPEPDRTWLALASYNVGFGHLEDARKLAQAAGEDPDKWIDIKETLPLLSQKKWYKQTKHGYARGWEPVKYVENIRKYYDLLVWNDRRQNPSVFEPSRPANSEGLTTSPSF